MYRKMQKKKKKKKKKKCISSGNDSTAQPFLLLVIKSLKTEIYKDVFNYHGYLNPINIK